jgi:Type I restriction enzyme R protein N terminus (HSDR_N)
MLTTSKKANLIAALKDYKKKYLDKNITDLDESGTRLMINSFLCDVLGYAPIEEIKTEYMIKGTYADYVVQLNAVRHFLVEVKALSFQLSEKHLRQTVNYGANEGIEWAALTNGKNFEFYKIIFSKPIEERKIFSVDLSDGAAIKSNAEVLQFLHKDSVSKKGLKALWNKFEALDPLNVAGILYSEEGLSLIRKIIRRKYDEKCEDAEIIKSLDRIVLEKIDPSLIKPLRGFRRKQNKEPQQTENIISPAAGKESTAV